MRCIGIVIRTTGATCRVLKESGSWIECSLKGKIRLQGLKSTNPIAVGDKVVFEQSQETATISEILPRQNYILRKSVKLSKQTHILCSNVNQAILVATIEQPLTKLGFIDRFLVTVEAYHIPVILIFNKIDLITNEKLKQKLEAYVRIYEKIGYTVLCLSAINEENTSKLTELLENKISFVAGLSGSGKSTLVNTADKSLNLRVGDISTFSQKGKHTTTFTEMHPLRFGGAVIDAPGLSEFELANFEKKELAQYFPEMRKLAEKCKYNNCQHLSEPFCAIKEAVETSEISITRYHTYIGMYEGIEEKWT